ncbi:hypothetical protein BXZ70DRAFT_768234 [Cristinia sonorae]|uniref:F-box domain-containing protein n=1 Tax=Cristinia sonorae TaxID=1940300 RepID=A0A8K0XRV6_9AGAR|nr:hypothetical protein BXZ70DRAFT_768234 [Cristinia sonorae]
MAIRRYTPSVLPQEIVEHIIDILWDHASSLRACSLVARSWLPRSRYHLRRVVLLSDQDPDEKLLLFQTESTAPLVEQLTIQTETQAHWLKWFPKMIRTVESLPRVSRLRIHSTCWDARLGDGYFRAQTHSLIQLTLDGVNFDSFATFTYVISAFPHLECLSLMYVRWSARLGPTRYEDWADGSMLRLKTLRLGWVFSTLAGKLAEITEWLQRGRVAPVCIQSLALGVTIPNDDLLQEALLRLTPSLRNIHVVQRIHNIRSLVLSTLDSTLADPRFVKLESVMITGVTYDTHLLNLAGDVQDGHVREKLPMLTRRKMVRTRMRMRLHDPTWFEKLRPGELALGEDLC